MYTDPQGPLYTSIEEGTVVTFFVKMKKQRCITDTDVTAVKTASWWAKRLTSTKHKAQDEKLVHRLALSDRPSVTK